LQTTKIVTSLAEDIDAPTQNLLGLRALAEELADEGASVGDLLRRTGVYPSQLEDPHARISPRQRLAIYRNARALARRSEVGLLAGARQRVSDFGIYGYAMTSSSTFGEALRLGVEHVAMASPVVMQISLRIEDNTAILRSDGVQALGDLLPFVAEFWRSSMTSLFSRVLEAPFPTKRMVFTFAPPPHFRSYERLFNCPIQFDRDSMEWHFDASVLERRCPNANPITASMSWQLCERDRADIPSGTELARQIRSAVLNDRNEFPTAEDTAKQLGLSLRTLHRRLARDGLSYQSVLDGMRCRVATEFLENTRLSMDQVAERVGFADADSFRKAFRRWTGHPPTHYRHGGLDAALAHPPSPRQETADEC
jgi:AraC-like DNA-binding protein